ncbi:SymE family type I addiction module toxin [Lonsdalea quercina]|uniref:SymE family type I addiction module toxin n=1 Tax=Lonsdalea quercina TaxID=71657 RepID=UPI003974B35B
MTDDVTIDKTLKPERYYSVGYAPHNGRRNPPSAINLEGRWLEASGFITGQPVTVNIEHGRLIIQVEGSV